MDHNKEKKEHKTPALLERYDWVAKAMAAAATSRGFQGTAVHNLKRNRD